MEKKSKKSTRIKAPSARIRGKGLESKVAQALHDAGISFKEEISMGGIRPDFLVESPDGRAIIIDAKNWQPVPGFVARAAHYAKRYQDITGIDHAFVVLDNLERNYENKGVISFDRFIETLNKVLEQPVHRKKQERTTPLTQRRDIVFAAMPFERQYDDVFLVAMRHAAKEIGAGCVRVDRDEFAGDIVDEIKKLIRKSIAVIVDLSESKPNVLYEAGYAHALNKKSVHICSTPLAGLPFDVRNWNTIPYKKGQTSALRGPLAKRLKAVIGR